MRTIVNLVLLFAISGLILAQTPDTSLIAYYPFNGNAIDVTGNGHNGTVNGGILTTDRFNQPDKAYTFPNLHNNIVLENTTGLNLENGFTINAWVKYKNINCGIVGKHNCWYVNGFNLGIDNGQFWLVLANSVWSIVKTNETYVEDKWYMVTGVYDQVTSTGKVFINGVLKASGSVLYNNYSTAPITISEASNGCPDGNMPGAIDEVKIYDRPLSDTEILDEYNRTYTDLVLFLPFNGNANDESGNNINPTYIGSGVTLTSDRFGINNRAFYFDGNDGSYIRLPADSLPTTSRTISLWINAQNLNNGKVPFSYGGNGCNTSSFIMVQNQNNNSAYRITGHCDQSMITYYYSTSTLNTWKHWVITIDGSTQKLYIDGELKLTENNYTGASYVQGRSAIIGGLIYTDGNTVYADPSSGYFKGKIDDIRIYKYALNDQQVLELYNDSTTYTPPNLEDGLALFLPFNGNANDESGNNNNGTVSGAQLTQDRFGVNGKAYSFNGASDFISIADNPNLFSDELTISWWYKLIETPGAAWVVTGWVDGGHRYQQFFSGGQIAYLNGYNLSQPGVYFNPLYGLNDLDVWKNVVVTYKKLTETTSTTSIYVDGELKQTDDHTLAMDYASGADFFIGKNHNGNFFKGSLDDFRIYNRILNNDEILELYNDSTTYNPPLEEGLVAYWPFSGNANDSTENQNNGTNYGGIYVKDRYGNDDNAIYFDGGNTFIEGNNPGINLPINDSPRSISVWIKSNEAGNDRNIFHYGYDAQSPTNYHFLLESGLYPSIGNGWGYGLLTSTQNVSDATWHFLTAVYEGPNTNLHKIYIDGKLDAEGNISNVPATTLVTNWKIGRFMGSGSSFYGNIDELKVFNYALTNQQVWEKYKTTTTAPNLIFPSNDSTLINPTMIGLVLDWDSTVTATGYRFLLANDSLFNTVIHDTIVNTSSFNFYDWFAVNIDNLYWKVRTINDGGIGPWSETNYFNIILTDVEEEKQLPTEFALFQNYPNPFNPATTITYHLPKTASVELKVYDVLGNEIATLVNEEKPAGVYNVQFTTDNLSSGIYFYKLTSGTFVSTKKMILIK